MKQFFFDLETTGFPIRKEYDKYYHPSKLEYYQDSRIIEIGYAIYEDKTLLFTKNFLIKPDNFEINNSHIHGITTTIANKDGLLIKDILDIIYNDLNNIECILAYNISFDFNVLLSECYRYKHTDLIKTLLDIKCECIMKKAKIKLKQTKSLKLKDLYEKLFNESANQNHRALDDVHLCAKCYFHLNE